MINQLQRHFILTLWTKQRVFAEAVEEALLKRLGRQNPVSSGVDGTFRRDNLSQLFSDLLIAHIAVESVISDSLKSFGQYMLNHPSDESQDWEGFVFNLSSFVIAIPVANGLTIVGFNSANGDRRRDNILCQIVCQPLSARWYFSRLKVSDESFGVIVPCAVNAFFHSGIGNIFSEHVQKMILPFSVHHLVRDIGDRFPLAGWINSSRSHEDVQVGVVMAGSPCGLENDDVSDIEFNSASGFKNVFEAGMSCSHEWTEQCGVTIKPCSQEFGHGQYDMTIGDAGQEPSADKVSPSFGVSLGAGQAEAGFTGKGDSSYFATLAAAVLDIAHLVGITATEHLRDGIVVVRMVKSWMRQLKLIPVIVKNLLEPVFVNAFHGCSLRTTIPEWSPQVEERVFYADRLKSPRRSRVKFRGLSRCLS